MKKEQPKKELSRMEIIYALAGHIRTTSTISYQEIIKWPTEYLQVLLDWYEKPNKEKKGIVIGIDWASLPERNFIRFTWPFGYTLKN